MTIKELINRMQQIENKDKEIYLLGNETNAEDDDFDINFNHLEIWDDGEESVTLFVTNYNK